MIMKINNLHLCIIAYIYTINEISLFFISFFIDNVMIDSFLPHAW